MHTVATVAAALEELAPVRLAEEWDNVGLLVGDPARPVTRIMTCLTITPATAAEAIDEQADLVVTHHPLPFQPLNRLTTDTVEGRLLWDLVAGRVAVYSAHTAFDSAEQGINQRLAEGIGLEAIEPLVVAADADAAGSGRLGRLPGETTLGELATALCSFLGLDRARSVGSSERTVTRVAVACGSGGSFLDAAVRRKCDCLVTGEARFHVCLEAESRQIGLLLAGHFASERFALERLAEVLARRFGDAEVWASRREKDPIEWL